MTALFLLFLALVGCLVAIIVFLLHTVPPVQWLLLVALILACVYFAADDGEEVDG